VATSRNQAQAYGIMLITGGLLCAIVAGCIAQTNAASRSAPAATSSAAAGTTSTATTAAVPRPTTTPPATTAPALPGAGPGERVTVAEVIDGDTFELTDGRRVRVLGIDSCEMDTPGGREARQEALPLRGGDVNLRTEPGVDTDRDGQLLRYVQAVIGGGQIDDYGLYMVRYDHTGVHQGDNDASPEYVQRLYAADLIYAANPPSGRECGEPDPPPAPAPDPDVDVDTGDDDDDDDRGRRGGSICGRFNPFC
jgi:endonuclease YncB( thermonuclease family)